MLTLFTFIDVLRTVETLVPRGAGTRVRSVDGTGIANGISVAGVGCTSIVQMAE